MTDAPYGDAWGTAEAVRRGEVTAVALAEAALERAAADPHGAVTLVTRDRALATAREVDEGRLAGPLAGVPVSIKDHVWVEGLPATNGSRALADFVAPRSAVCVDRLLDAGAVLVARTNNPEFCYRGTTDNELYGVTRNPRDPTRTAGGSSGGAAASVASGIVPLAVGTDGGGSIRIPSAFCGVPGLKPSYGVVPKVPGFRGWPTLSVTGPIAASVRDLALALSVMAGPAGDDWLSGPTGHQGWLEAVTDRRGEGLRVAVVPDLGVADVDADVLAAVDRAAQALTRTAVRRLDVALPTADPLPLWDAVALPEGWASEGPLVEAHPELVGDDARAIALAGRDVDARAYLDAQEARASYAARWAAVFDEVDLVVAAAMPCEAFPLGQQAPSSLAGVPVRDGFDTWCALAVPANLAGLPALSVPVGVGATGLPVAVQVIGARWRDDLVLRGAALLEAALRDA
ncbi:amidase [Lapillicoccus jejuensis]|uniref:Aspartyl-tRNA(Asn)/glutamyl-tRNA(Gln) amidotransferase subunit A n=1 Tax=Lapillicoccus jejuensis TaxID=402171 RepID=A0A542E1Z9_9MICO|nr:amidase [Lapillicoccus jejuensis]TQJ09360.1 aspartyl-tRNA(Asn)/glutamyl-tRNA(Gln) amidotransferase subunit A [Lapillicoccus jejuensis]